MITQWATLQQMKQDMPVCSKHHHRHGLISRIGTMLILDNNHFQRGSLTIYPRYSITLQPSLSSWSISWNHHWPGPQLNQLHKHCHCKSSLEAGYPAARNPPPDTFKSSHPLHGRSQECCSVEYFSFTWMSAAPTKSSSKKNDRAGVNGTTSNNPLPNHSLSLSAAL